MAVRVNIGFFHAEGKALVSLGWTPFNEGSAVIWCEHRPVASKQRPPTPSLTFVRDAGTRNGGMTADNDNRGERLRKGRTLAERRQERHDALIEAALEVFGTKGYAASSVDEICRQAYVSSRNFYEEFANREALLGALGKQIAGKLYHAMTDVEVEPGPDLVRRRTRARISGLIHAIVDDPRVARTLFVESIGVSAENEARRRQAHHAYARWIREYLSGELATKGIDEPRQHALALALVGAANELIGDWVLLPPEQRSTIDELIDVIVELATIILQRKPSD